MSLHSLLPGKADCCWTDAAPPTSYPSLSGSSRTEVAVIGAGMVGLTAAHKLLAAGSNVRILEARKVGHQVTGRSSAKIVSQHGLIYDICATSTVRIPTNAARQTD